MRDFLASLYEKIAGLVREGKSREEAKAAGKPLAAGQPDWRGENFLYTAIDVIYASLAPESAQAAGGSRSAGGSAP